MRDGKEPPYVLCSRCADGEIAVATLPRNLGAGGRACLSFPLADVTLEVGEFNRPVGIFGKYASLTLVGTTALAGKRIIAQDLAARPRWILRPRLRSNGGRANHPGRGHPPRRPDGSKAW